MKANATSKQSKPTRLSILHNELNALDAEIADLQNSLSDSTVEEEEFPETPPRYGYSNRDNFEKSDISTFSRRFPSHNSFSDESDIIIPRIKPKIKGYRPPSQRALEKSVRKERQIFEYHEEQERRFQEECTFRPHINSRSKNIPYDSTHLYESKVRKKSPPPVFSASKRRSKNSDDEMAFFDRQFKKKRSASVASMDEPRRKTITPEEENAMLRRLTKPKKQVHQEEEAPSRTYRKRDPETFERLVTQSITSVEKEHDARPAHRSQMNPVSRELAKGHTTDLFLESVESHGRLRQKAEDEKRWREEMEEKEIQQAAEKRRRQTTRVPASVSRRKVAGMADHVERMAKKRREVDEEPDPPRSSIRTDRPFSFESRVRDAQPYRATESRYGVTEREVADVLDEINQLLRS